MKNNLFKNTVLTVIALNLSYLSFDKISNTFTEDLITSNAGHTNVPLNEDGSINVKIINSETIKVDITITSTNDELDVNIDEVGGGFVRFGRLNVEID